MRMYLEYYTSNGKFRGPEVPRTSACPTCAQSYNSDWTLNMLLLRQCHLQGGPPSGLTTHAELSPLPVEGSFAPPQQPWRFSSPFSRTQV